MNKKLLFLVLLFAFFCRLSNAQPICAADAIHEELMQRDQAYAQRYAESIKDWIAYQEKNNKRAYKVVVTGSDTIYEIPVVMHVFHTGGAIGSNYNKNDAALIDWINYTNEIFAGTATGYYGPDDGGAIIPFRLVLAQKDVNCNPIPGIFRHDMSANAAYVNHGINRDSTNGLDDDDIFALSRMDPNYYYNIYVVNKIDSWDMYTAGSGVVGWAYYPETHNNWYGTVMLSATVSTSNNTFAHEFGHSMGLRHTFQGGGLSTCPPIEVDCTAEGDLVCDTERHFYTWGPCPSNTDINICTGVAYTGTQYNVMSYGSCSRAFTPGQAERAIYQMKKYRSGLMKTIVNDSIRKGDTIAVVACAPTVGLGVADLDGIYEFEFGSIFNKTGGADVDGFRHKDFTKDSCLKFPMVHTSSVGEVIEYKVQNQGFTDYIKLYIDLNGDGIFQSTEMINDFGDVHVIGDMYGSFTVPSTIKKGEVLRIRVIVDYEPILDPCNYLVYGQMEDYGLFVVDPMSSNHLELSVNSQACQHLINWSVGNVEKVVSMDVEASTDGQQFDIIHTINIDEQNSINEYLHSTLNSNKYYYRLKVLHIDGQLTYSNVVFANNDCNPAINIFPNPSDGHMTLQYRPQQNERGLVEVYDITGKLVHTLNVYFNTNTQQYLIDISHLPAAPYMLQVRSNTVHHKQGVIVKL